MRSNCKVILVLLVCVFYQVFTTRFAWADTFSLSADARDNVVGELRYITALRQDTLLDIGRDAGMGYEEIIKANPDVNRWVPGSGTRVLLPNLYVLPQAPMDGIVLNLPELRLYYYSPAKKGVPRTVSTYPVSIGRMDWRTPLGKTKIVKKEKDPPWRPTESIRREHAAEGDILPPFIPGGSPENPLGRFALRLGIPQYLIHGTDDRKAYGIGMRVTHGCVRMYPEDIRRLFSQVVVGTPVLIVDQPIKAGRRGNSLLLEVDGAFEEEGVTHTTVSVSRAMELLQAKAGGPARIDAELVAQVVRRGDGVPVVVGSTSTYSVDYDARSVPFR
ncbi:MAG: L,D-transpeptidase family protein [Deltaproteobacteria bacterium]|nr:L,D-transpeptidase family protein [Deltaproteobacteria bacterium]